MTSVTGDKLLRGRLVDRFSPFSRFARRAFPDRNSQPYRMVRASTRGSPFVGVARDASGLEDELLLVPVVVVDVGAVESLDHFGGTGAGLDGLEDAEGNERAAVFVVQAVRIDDEGDMGEGFGEVEGVHADLPVLAELTPILQSALGFSDLSP